MDGPWQAYHGSSFQVAAVHRTRMIGTSIKIAACITAGIRMWAARARARPATDGQRIDLDALGRSIDRLIDSGVHAIAPLGSTGEGAYLSDAEWDEVSAYSLAKMARRVPTVVSVSDLTTAKAVRRARYAEANGADVVMVLPMMP